MNTRRKFLVQGSLTAAALFVSKPFKAFAGGAQRLFSPAGSRNHLVLLHTTGLRRKTLSFFSAIKNKTANAVLLHTGKGNTDTGIAFDACTNEKSGFSAADYSVISKGSMITGIIYVNDADSAAATKANRLAAYLKKQKNCQVVACVSKLGYNNSDRMDDKQLAAASKNIDIIIGAHATNFSKHPMVLHNCCGQEVIVQNAAASEAAFGKIEIGFDHNGQKNHIHLLSSFAGKYEQQHCIVAA